MSTTPPPSPELLRLKKQAVKRFHPDNAVDKEDEIRLTRLMQAANAAFDARDEAALRAVFAPPQAPPPQAPPNAWGPRTYRGAAQSAPPPPQAPPQQPKAAQAKQQAAASQPIQPQKLSLEFKAWFWIIWLLWAVPCLVIGGADHASKNTVQDMWALFLVGLFISLFAAHYRAKIQQWVRAQLPRTKFDQAVVALAFIVLILGLVGVGSHTTAAPAPPVQSITKQGATSAPASTDETDYMHGIIREVDRNFVFFAAKGYPNPPNGTAVDMSFQVGPTGYHNAASVVKSSGDSGLDWACTQAVDKSSNFGTLPASTKGGNILVSYRCVFNAPDAITKVAILPATSDIPKAAQAHDYPALANKSSETWNGLYTGTVHNNSGVDAEITVIIKQSTAAISGYFSVNHPLYGSGPLTGTTVADGGIEFHVVPASPTGYEMDFKGHPAGPGVVSGSYSVSNGQSGTFTMHPQSTTTSPVQGPKPFNNRFGWYVDQVKTRVAQNWYLREVSDDTPAGATVYVQFQIGKKGYPTEVSVQTSSGHNSLDQSCVKAVERTDNFGPLPVGYKESTLNVLYHCTYPGRPSQSSPVPAVASYIPPTPPSVPVVEPVAAPVDKAWRDYTNMVDALIDQRWRQTAYAGQVRGWVGVRFSVAPDGLVGDPRVTVSSGSTAIDAACKAVVGDPIGWYAPRLPEGYNSPVFLAYVCK